MTSKEQEGENMLWCDGLGDLFSEDNPARISVGTSKLPDGNEQNWAMSVIHLASNPSMYSVFGLNSATASTKELYEKTAEMLKALGIDYIERW